MNKYISIVMAGLLIVIVALLARPHQQFGNANVYLNTSMTNSVAVMATVSHTILSANTARSYAKCTNDGPQRVDVTFGTTASRNWGFSLWASQSFELQSTNLYVGKITGTTPSETGSTSANYGRVQCVEGSL